MGGARVFILVRPILHSLNLQKLITQNHKSLLQGHYTKAYEAIRLVTLVI